MLNTIRHQVRFLALLAAVLSSIGTVSTRSQAADATYVPSKVMWTTTRANVGAGPGTGYRTVDRLEVGEEVRVIAKTGNWYQLEPLTEQPRRFVAAPLLSATRPAVEILPYRGGTYRGPTRSGVPHGRGTLTWPDGARYEGDFAEGRLHGYGTKTDPSGTVTQGQWRDGAFVAATSRASSTQNAESAKAASAEPSWGTFVASSHRSGGLRFDLATVIVLLVLATGIVWAFDAAVLARRRLAVARQAEGTPEEAVVTPAPRLVRFSKGYFPVFLIVLVLGSFIVEPFRIPSISMMPTLLTGDFILVNKFDYGLRLPVVDTKIVAVGLPQRGDVVVFRFPQDAGTPFIKRVVGVPGDRIGYHDKVLYINGERTDESPVWRYVGVGSGAVMSGASMRRERIADAEHAILIEPGVQSADGEAVVPEGHYFVLGDNRDRSSDSRDWGTVPEDLIIGKAFRIWGNWDFGHGIQWKRIGKAIE